MKKSEIQLLLVVFGILIAFASWQFAYKKNMEQAEQVRAENEELQKTVDRLELLNAKKPEYIAGTEQMKTDCDALINRFASGVRTEDQVMYLYNMELVGANEVRVPSVSMTTAQEVVYGGALTTEEGYELVDDGIRMYRMDSTVNLTTTNNGLKNVLHYIYGMDSRKSIETVSLVASENGYLSGSMKLNFFFLDGTGNPYVDQNIPGVSTGTGNIFGVLNGAYSQGGGAQDTDGQAANDAGGAEED